MSKIRIHPSENLVWTRMGDIYPPEMIAVAPQDELDGTFCEPENGADGSLSIAEFNFKPGVYYDLHAHNMDEIIYVVGGTLLVGNRSLGPGSVVYVSKLTLYSLAAGDDGVRILVFRGGGEMGYWNKEQFIRERPDQAYSHQA